MNDFEEAEAGVELTEVGAPSTPKDK